MNNVILIGRLTKDVETKYTASQMAISTFTLAVDRAKKEEQSADFIRITAFGKTAENCERFLSKGKQVAVIGRIQTGQYKDKDGKTVYTTDVVADRVEFIGEKSTSANLVDKAPAFEEVEEDIPF